MKKLVLIIAVVFLGTPSIFATTTEDKVAISNAYNNGNSFIFVENGVTFSVYPDGEFDFYIDNRVNVGVGARIGNVGLTFNSGYNYNPYVQYDDYGAIVQVENIPVYYDYYGRVSQIGSVDVWYSNGRVRRVGGLNVYYNGGVFSHYTGFVNVYNRGYVYRPFHRYFARPALGFCTVWNTPYRRYYNPVRYSFHSPYRNNVRRAYVKRGREYRYNNRRNNIYRNDKRVVARTNATRRGGDYGRNRNVTSRSVVRSNNNGLKKSGNRTSVNRNTTVRQGTVKRGNTTVQRSNRGNTATQRTVTRTPRSTSVTKRQVTQTPRQRTVTRSTTTYKKPQTRTSTNRAVASRNNSAKRTVSRSSSTTVKRSSGNTGARKSNASTRTRSSRVQ
ncbi:MAG: hypothetical protein ABJN84_00310 [Flavobacteriaceae bacterium]